MEIKNPILRFIIEIGIWVYAKLGFFPPTEEEKKKKMGFMAEPTKITINNLADQKEYVVVRTVKPGRVIIDFEGEFVFADWNSTDLWQRSQEPPTEEERLIIKDLIANNGGFDQTDVEITKTE